MVSDPHTQRPCRGSDTAGSAQPTGSACHSCPVVRGFGAASGVCSRKGPGNGSGGSSQPQNGSAALPADTPISRGSALARGTRSVLPKGSAGKQMFREKLNYPKATLLKTSQVMGTQQWRGCFQAILWVGLSAGSRMLQRLFPRHLLPSARGGHGPGHAAQPQLQRRQRDPQAASPGRIPAWAAQPQRQTPSPVPGARAECCGPSAAGPAHNRADGSSGELGRRARAPLPLRTLKAKECASHKGKTNAVYLQQ